MSVSVVIYGDETRRRSVAICQAMFQGIRAVGDKVDYLRDIAYVQPDADVAVFYGMSGNLRRIFEDYQAVGRIAVYIDLGYWSRRAPGGRKTRYNGYHKFSINARHPTAYFRNRQHDGGRLAVHGIAIQPWRSAGGHILIAGMGTKASKFEGFPYEEWERSAIDRIRAMTDRPIVYRPKPNCKQAKPIAGTIYSPPEQPIEAVLSNCHAVVTHHSNVAVDGLVAGVPCFCWEGVATPLALQSLAQIESPVTHDGREQWAADIAWTQWNLAEMADGSAWRYLRDEGLVP